MKKISEVEKNMLTVGTYDFSDVFEDSHLDPGHVLCYALLKHTGYVIDTADVCGDINKLENEQYHGRNTAPGHVAGLFPDYNSFLKKHPSRSFERFTIRISYKDTDISIEGQSGSTEITVSYSKERLLILVPLFQDITAEIGELLLDIESHAGRMTKKDFEYKSPHIKKLQEYEDAEEDGRLLKLPCKPGDTVYGIRGTGKPTGHFGAYPIPVKNLMQIVGYMEKKMFGDKVFVYINQAQEKADQITTRNLQKLRRYKKKQLEKNKELHR